jgi:hypothetical protein
MTEREPDRRASEEDRERFVSILREHMAAGHLDTSDFSDRVGRALVATTLVDLEGLVRDLPPLVPAPVPNPRTRRQRSVIRRYQRQLAHWEAARSLKQSQLDLARGGRGEHHIDFPCSAGETIIARIPGTSLRLWVTTPGHTERQTTSRYSRSVFGGGQRTGTTRTYQVPGHDVQVTADVGVL